MSEESARLCVLGAGSILPREGYGPAGYALSTPFENGVTLLDCGPGSVRALARHGLGAADVRRIVFSHYHLDHCLDLFALIFARRNPSLRDAPRLELFGPRGLERLVSEAPRALGRWAQDGDLELCEVEVDEEGRGGFRVAAGLTFRCVRTEHTPEAVAWRVDADEPARMGPVCYTGDTGPHPPVAELARGVELFVLECSFPEEEAVPNHLTPRSAGELARDAGARRALLTHFYPTHEPAQAAREAARVFAGRIELAHDGSVHPLV